MSNTDFTPEEAEFQAEIRAALASAGACPRPQMLMAAVSGVAFEGAEDVLRHLAACPVCGPLSRDLAEHQFPAVSPEEDRRIRARFPRVRDRSPLWRRWLIPAMAAAALVLAVVVLVKRPLRNAALQQISGQNPPPNAAAANTLPVSPAPIRIPAAAVLTFRGGTTNARGYMADLMAALQPYRQGDYLHAANALDALSKKYPNAVEPSFYLGVCQLLLNENQDAAISLEDARRRGATPFKDDISWYLAVAYQHLARIADARQEAAAVCAHPGDYHDRACQAMAELTAR